MKQLKEIFDRLAEVQNANNIAREELEKKVKNEPAKENKKEGDYGLYLLSTFFIMLSYIALLSISSDVQYCS